MKALKVLMVMVVVLLIGKFSSVFAEEIQASQINQSSLPYLNIGTDPWPELAEKLFSGETVYVLNQDVAVKSQGKKGRWTVGLIPVGTEVVANAYGQVTRIFRCGNPVLGLTTGQPLVIQGFKQVSYNPPIRCQYDSDNEYSYQQPQRRVYYDDTRRSQRTRTTGETFGSYLRTGSKAYAAGEAFKQDSPGNGVAWGLSAVEDLREGGDLWQTLFTIGVGIVANNNTSKPKRVINNYYPSGGGGLPLF